MEEHAAMKKNLQLYVEQGDVEDEDDDLVVVNNSPNVMPKRTAQTVWSRLFGSGSGAAPVASAAANDDNKEEPVDALLTEESPSASVPEPAPVDAPLSVEARAGVPPSFSMLLLSDLGELLSHLRVETINQLDSANAQLLSAALYGKVNFHRTKRMFEEELRGALVDLQKRTAANGGGVVVQPLAPLKKVEEPEDALAAIEKDEKKEALQEAAVKPIASASYAAVVAASVGATSSSSSASSASYSSPLAAPAPLAEAAVAAPAAQAAPVEKKSGEWSSSPAVFSMSDASVSQVMGMCRELGFNVEASKVKYFMSKSNGDYAALIDWLMTDSVVKLNVPK